MDKAPRFNLILSSRIEMKIKDMGNMRDRKRQISVVYLLYTKEKN